MPYYYYGFDPTYFLVIIGAVICMIASARVKSTYNKYSQYRSASGMTGAQAAQRILNSAGIYDVTIQHVSGNLTDHYNPSAKTLNLSDSVYNSTSVAAVGVAAHECGHAIQHQNSYFPLTLRTAIVPAANLGSTLAWPLILIGLFFTRNTGAVLINLGIICFSFAVIFQLVTLPVEFNASARALRILGEQGILSDSENDWMRAYNEINEFEKELHDWGAVIIKFWVQIDKDTQLERFNERQNTPEKQWKITDEDWRNRDKWDAYETAVNEMIQKTSTSYAPWHILESVDKKYARIKALKIVVEELEKVLG